jgi:hypothetical protein
MTHICSNCDKIFDYPGKYCSKRCAREVRKYWRQVLLASVVGLVAVMFTNYTASNDGLFSEPCPLLSESGLYELASDDSCLTGMARIKSLAKPAVPEKFFAWTPVSTALDLAQKVGSYVGFAQAPAI